jgi:hypothetical protein
MPPLAPASGTVATIKVSDQLTTGAVRPPRVKELLPWVAPNPVPAICICAPSGPLVGDTLVTTGLGTVKSTSPLLETPLTVTFTGPVVGLEATVAVICVSLQAVVVAVLPFTVRVLDPFVAWKPDPVTVI